MNTRSSDDRSHEQSWSWLFRSDDVPFKKNRPLQIMIVVFVIVWVICAIHPVKMRDWLLDNALLVLFVGTLAFLYRKFAFSNISYFLITVFCILHTIGAHYTYQQMPFDDWITRIFHTKRAMYDRIVHFAFGLLLMVPILEITVRVMKLRSRWAYFVTFATVLASAALFEILELLVALAAGASGEKYLGLQGDALDTPKDMAMNLIGVLLSIGVIALLSYFNRHQGHQKE